MKRKLLVLSLLLTAPVWAGAPETAGQLNQRAVQLYREGRYLEAEALYLRALAAPPSAGAPAEERAVIKGNLGMTLRATGRYPVAENLLTESLAELEAITGPDSAAVGHAWMNLATLYRAQGALDKAEAAANRAETLVQGTDADANRLVLASIFADQRRYQQAEALLKGLLPSAHGVMEVVIRNNLAQAALGQGQLDRSEMYARQAVDRARLLETPSPVVLAAALNNLAQACRFQGRYAEAEDDYITAIRIMKQTAGASHPDAERMLLNLAALYHDQGRESDAEELNQ